jgi:putative oxidoreductase
MKRFNLFFKTKKEYGAIFLRLIIGWRLIAGVWSIVSHKQFMGGTVDYFTQLHLAFPEFSAYLAVYSEFTCAVLFIIGLWMRPAALLMVINFTVAIAAAHLHESIVSSFSAWAIWAGSIFLLFNGAGRLSIDRFLAQD